MKKKEVAAKIIKLMVDAGISYNDMLIVIEKARGLYNRKNQKNDKPDVD